MKKIYLLGECMVELMAAEKASPSGAFVKRMNQAFAGDVFNTAVYLKRLFKQHEVSLVTAVGQDHFSEDMVEFFQHENLNTQYVFRSEDKIPGLYAISLDDTGERSFTYWRENSAARTVMKFINDEFIAQTNAGDIFFFSGISLGVISPQDRNNFWLFIQKLKAKGVKIGFDLNYRPKLWLSKSEAQSAFNLAFKAADILLPGVDDFDAIFDLADIPSIIKFFNDYHYEELVIKNGEKNVFCLSPGETQVVDVTPVENVVDTTSAGDSFNGAYLGARMSGYSMFDAVELANQVAGFVIQHKGAIVDKSIFSSSFTKINKG